MNLKRLIGIILLGFFTIQFNITSCSPTGNDDEGGLADINNPTNDYEVVVEIISVGGLGGCTTATVSLHDQGINNAIVKVNDVTLAADNSSILTGMYADTLFKLSYASNTEYTLNIAHMGDEIASGTATMPTMPVFTNLNSIRQHYLNRSMKVTWQSVENATSLELSLGGDVYDPSIMDSVYREFNSGLIEAAATSFTIPDTFFTMPGQYTLGLAAYHGVNPGADVDEMTSSTDSYDKSYNMEGAAGVFIAVNLSSIDGEPITVSAIGKTAEVIGKRPSYKDMLLNRQKRLFYRK